MTKVGETMSRFKLEQCLLRIVDNRGKTPPLTESGIGLIEVNAVESGRKSPNYENIHKYVSAATFATWFRSGHPKTGDTLISTVGAIGRVSFVREERGCIAQNVIALRPNGNIVDGEFLYYYLASSATQKRLRNLNIGVAQPSLKVPHLLSLEVVLPSLAAQQQVVRLLSPYDDLIENNQRRIRILEEMARALYREWFVDFRYPGHENVPLVASALGEIPEGWAIVKLSEVAEVNRASINAGSAPDEVHYIDISSVSTGSIDSVATFAFEDAPGRARRIVKHGDILWSCVRPNRRSYAQIMYPSPNTIVSTGFAVLTATGVPYSFLYLATTTDAFVSYLTNSATGAAYPAVNGNTFERADLLIPRSQLLTRFNDVCVPMSEQISLLQHQIQNLRTTRELLLPPLMSGQINF